MEKSVLLDVEGNIATVTLNNPDKRNALTKAAWGKLAYVMVGLNNRDDIRCIIVRGAGTKAFAAGADISEFPQNRANAEQAIAYGNETAMALQALLGCKHPTIAMIYGACTGGGLEIACCCDLRIAGQSARFGVPINRIGHAFAPPEMKPVLDLVGPALVLELLLEGRIFDADEARERGILTRVVADDDLESEVGTSADRIAAGAPLGARMTKKFVRRLLTGKPLTEEELADSYTPCDSEDYAEGIRAFLAKEKPDFKGR